MGTLYCAITRFLAKLLGFTVENDRCVSFTHQHKGRAVDENIHRCDGPEHPSPSADRILGKLCNEAANYNNQILDQETVESEQAAVLTNRSHGGTQHGT